MSALDFLKLFQDESDQAAASEREEERPDQPEDENAPSTLTDPASDELDALFESAREPSEQIGEVESSRESQDDRLSQADQDDHADDDPVTDDEVDYLFGGATGMSATKKRDEDSYAPADKNQSSADSSGVASAPSDPVSEQTDKLSPRLSWLTDYIEEASDDGGAAFGQDKVETASDDQSRPAGNQSDATEETSDITSDSTRSHKKKRSGFDQRKTASNARFVKRAETENDAPDEEPRSNDDASKEPPAPNVSNRKARDTARAFTDFEFEEEEEEPRPEEEPKSSVINELYGPPSYEAGSSDRVEPPAPLGKSQESDASEQSGKSDKSTPKEPKPIEKDVPAVPAARHQETSPSPSISTPAEIEQPESVEEDHAETGSIDIDEPDRDVDPAYQEEQSQDVAVADAPPADPTDIESDRGDSLSTIDEDPASADAQGDVADGGDGETPPPKEADQKDGFLNPPVTDFRPGESIRIENRIETVREEVLGGDGHLEHIDEEQKDGHSLDLGGNAPIADLSNWMRSADRMVQESASVEEGDGESEPIDVEDAIRRDRVVAFLLRSEIVTSRQVARGQEVKQKEDLKEVLWRIIAEQEDVEKEDVYTAAARVYAFPIADLEEHPPNIDFTKQVMNAVSEEQRDKLIELRLVPHQAVRERNKESLKLRFITHDPARPAVNKQMRELGIDSFELQYASEAAIIEIITEAFPRKNEYLERIADDDAMDLGTNYDQEDSLIDEDKLEAEISRSKLINLFEATLIEAVREGASDIHIYPNAEKKVEVHFRVDGRLHHWHTEDKVHPEALLAVIKDNAMNVDRFERDKAQDGFIQRWVDDALIRYRVSVMPIANASQEIRSESIVIRVLDDRKVITDLSKLGLLEGALEKFEHAINQPHGMVILTGPTGSGKSTTLVASLSQVVSPEVNVLTIEDPVEYIIPDVRQIKLSHKLQLDQALRSILRHDPDVVMVGEMRDRATAELAIKLANTGHLTFSTLHTNDAPSAISRLYKMDIEPFLIAYAINLVVAQRLIRTLCPDCKVIDDDPDPVMLKKLGFTEEDIANNEIYTEGYDDSCPTCNGFSYKGRRAVAEALYFSREIRHMIVEADRMIDEDKIRELAQEQGMLTLQDSAREVVKFGETSVREMIRVVTTEAH